jgi:hypothetical protein
MKILFLSPDDPFAGDGGLSIGIESDINVLSRLNHEIGVACLCPVIKRDLSKTLKGVRSLTVIKPKTGSRYVRVFRSLFRPGVPPSVERFYSRKIKKQILDLVVTNAYDAIFVHDASLSGFIPYIRRVQPKILIVCRLNNVMADLSAALWREARGFARIGAFIEQARWPKFEWQACNNAEQLWCVTQAEVQRIHELYSARAVLVPLSIPLSKYSGLPLTPRDRNLLVHVGTIDMRRETSAKWFLECVWPKLQAVSPSMRAVFAGLSPPTLDFASHKVMHLGRCDDILHLLSEAEYFVNFQRSPGGIKLKSIVALASGCTLLSTTEGVEGLDIVDGVHYINIERCLESGDFSEVFASMDGDRGIAANGRRWVVERFGFETLAEQARLALAQMRL